jgi:hypothetical protein
MADDRASLIQLHREGWGDIYSLDVAAMQIMRGEATIYSRDFKKHPPKTKGEKGLDISGEPSSSMELLAHSSERGEEISL